MWTEFGMSIMGRFLICLPVCDLGLDAGVVCPGIDRTQNEKYSPSTINCVLCGLFSLTFSTYRWSKAGPERNHFSAGINPSLPQATHPQGTSCVYGSDNLTHSHSLDIWRLSVLRCFFCNTFLLC